MVKNKSVQDVQHISENLISYIGAVLLEKTWVSWTTKLNTLYFSQFDNSKLKKKVPKSWKMPVVAQNHETQLITLLSERGNLKNG